MVYKYFFLVLIPIVLLGCKKKGCTDTDALNYDANAETDNGSCKYEELSYAVERIAYGEGTRQHFDLYLPEGHDENTKTIILIHGGAWVLGPQDEDSVYLFNGTLNIDIANPLIQEGYALAVMKYRLACYTDVEAELNEADPLSYYDDIKSDIDDVMLKLNTNANTLGIAEHNFALLGESAGGQIALLYALSNINLDIKTVVSFYGPTLLDEEVFKTNSGSAPYTTFGVNEIFAVKHKELGCDLKTSGTIAINWALNSYVGKKLTTGVQHPEFTDPLSPARPENLVHNLPVFLMHGTADDLVPVAHGDSLLNALNAKFGTSPGGENDFTSRHKFKKYNNCGHGWIGNSCNTTQIAKDVVKWMNEKL